MMTGGTWSNEPTTFEKYNLPFSAYALTSIIVAILIVLGFAQTFRIGAKNRLVINEKNLKIVTSILQREKIIDWDQVQSIKQDYKNWNIDVSDQIWILDLIGQKKK